jgi:hypothetical protein
VLVFYLLAHCDFLICHHPSYWTMSFANPEKDLPKVVKDPENADLDHAGVDLEAQRGTVSCSVAVVPMTF